jgi:hypothetical protein
LSASILASAALYALLRFAICFFSLCSCGLRTAPGPATTTADATLRGDLPSLSGFEHAGG